MSHRNSLTTERKALFHGISWPCVADAGWLLWLPWTTEEYREEAILPPRAKRKNTDATCDLLHHARLAAHSFQFPII